MTRARILRMAGNLKPTIFRSPLARPTVSCAVCQKPAWVSADYANYRTFQAQCHSQTETFNIETYEAAA